MTLEEAAKLRHTDAEGIFREARERHGLALSPGNHKSDYAWYLRWNELPLYVTRYLRELDKLQRYRA